MRYNVRANEHLKEVRNVPQVDDDKFGEQKALSICNANATKDKIGTSILKAKDE